MAKTIEITGIDERIKQMQQLSTTNPLMRYRIQEVIKKVLAQVRKNLQKDAKSGLNMDSDPRKAYKAVRMAVYRRILGGNVNILQSRRAKQGNYYEPPRTLKAGQRGGNRIKQSDRTKQFMTYEGADRGFILRFLNAGTGNRGIKHFNYDENRKVDKWNKHPNTGFRGSISPRNWFGNRSQQEMENAAANIDKMIDDIITGIMF